MCTGLQKDCHHGTGGDKEGFISIGRFESKTTGKGTKKDGKHMNLRNNRKVGRNVGKIYKNRKFVFIKLGR